MPTPRATDPRTGHVCAFIFRGGLEYKIYVGRFGSNSQLCVSFLCRKLGTLLICATYLETFWIWPGWPWPFRIKTIPFTWLLGSCSILNPDLSFVDTDLAGAEIARSFASQPAPRSASSHRRRVLDTNVAGAVLVATFPSGPDPKSVSIRRVVDTDLAGAEIARSFASRPPFRARPKVCIHPALRGYRLGRRGNLGQLRFRARP